MRRVIKKHQRGFALVAALFLLIVVAVLGTVAARVDMAQQGEANLELAMVGADMALQTGIQYATARLQAANCGGLPATLPSLPQGFSVSFSNCTQLAVANAPPVTVFSVIVTASRGQYGTPDFVSRQRSVRVMP